MFKIIRQNFILKPFSIFVCATFLFQIVYPAGSFALTSGPSTPEIQSFEPVGTTQLVDPFSGDFNYNIPLMDVGGYPINLHYHAGIGMEQEASWVGLGWNINPGVINRNIRGIPDDFKGDGIQYQNNVKDYRTYALDVEANINLEVFGIGLESGVNASVTHGISFFYNNYKGVGFSTKADANCGLELKEGRNIKSNVNLEFSSHEGFNIAMDRNVTFGSEYIGLGYNSRSGLSDIHFGTNRKINKKSKSSSREKRWTVPFSNGSYSPVSRPNFITEGQSFSVAVGIELFGIYPPITKARFSTTNHYLSPADRNYTRSANGYCMSQFSDPYQYPNALMDKQNSGGYGFDRFSHYLGISTHAYDILSVSGQGIGSQFRPHRNQLGLIWEPSQVYSNKALTDNKISTEVGIGNFVKLGTDLETTFSWGDMGILGFNREDYYEHFKSKFFSKDDKDLKEPVYFKDMGDMAFLDNDYYNDLQEGKAVKISIDDITSDFPSMPPQYYWDKWNNIVTNQPEDLILNGGPIQMPNRQIRSNSMQYLNVSETLEYGAKTANYYEQGSSTDHFESYPFTENSLPAHHLAEITTLGNNGSRYVYGLPAIVNDQKEASFSVEETGAYNNTEGLIKYETGDASIGNTKGIDNYFHSMQLPEHAYAYHLTAILSPDYADLTGDGPTPDDFGDYTKFNYQKVSNFKWRAPFKDANLNKGLISNKKDDKASYLYGVKDIWILRSIESKTHFALFITSAREDGMEPKTEHNLTTGDYLDDTKKLQQLDEIRLYTREQIVIAPNTGFTDVYPKSGAIPIKNVHFEYSYDLCNDVINNTGDIVYNTDQPPTPKQHPLDQYQINTTDDYNRQVNHKKGKLTLHKVYFTYGNSSKGSLNPYLFEYLENTAYKFKASDRWGTYSPNLAADGNNPTDYSSLSEHPYTKQDNRSTKADKYAAMWSLSSIYLPSGGKMNIEYESDDYAYVQDKKAMKMMKIAGFVKSVGEELAPTNKLYDINENNLYILFPMNFGEEITDYIPDGDAFGDLYFNMFVDLSPFDATKRNAEEYVRGYCNIEEKGNYSQGGNYYGYVKINSLEIKDKSTSPKYINPISGSAFQFIKGSMPWLVYHGSDWNNSSSTTLGKVMGTIFSMIPELVRMNYGYNASMKMLGYANKVNTSMSFIRLNVPGHKKLGGGHRVKSIKINDGWEELSGESSHTYGQVFDYTANEGNTIISSGVASYEPLIGGDEIPQRQPQYKRIKQRMMQDLYIFGETTVGEDLFPAAGVGYSKVTVRDLKPSDIGLSTIFVTQHQTGTTEYEFYTFKDFPTYVNTTKLDKYFFDPHILSFIGHSVSKSVGSQGFAIELNDMHGKPKSVRNKDVKGFITNSAHYIYKTNSEKKLDNNVTVLNKNGATGTGILGLEIETLIEPLESRNFKFSPKIEFNLDVMFLAAIPSISFSLFPSCKSSQNYTKTVTTSKIIHRHGILEKVIVSKNGSDLSTENIAWDSETGEVLLTKTQTQYKGEYDYNLTIPAHFAYQGMEGAYKNINANFTATVSDGVISFPEQWMITKGDELSVAHPTSKILMDKAWVLDENQNILNPAVHPTASLIKTNGDKYPNGTYLFKVIRSGYRNMQTFPIASILMSKNPIVSNRFDSYLNTNNLNILAASALELRDSKQLYPYFQTFIFKGCDELGAITIPHSEVSRKIGYEYAVQSSLSGNTNLLSHTFMPSASQAYNPYALGIKGVYYPYRTYSYYDKDIPERTTSVNLNNSNPDFNLTKAQTDGHLSLFTPFWSLLLPYDPNNVYTKYWNPTTVDGLNDELIDKWTWTALIDILDPHGQEIQNLNPLGINNCAQYGYNKKFAVAVASNAKHERIVFDGFEEYKKGDLFDCNSPFAVSSIYKEYFKTPWHWYLWPNLTKDRAGISTDESHSGKQSLEIQMGTVEVPFNLMSEPPGYTYFSGLQKQFFLHKSNVIHPFYPNYEDGKDQYLLTYWAKYDRRIGKPQILFQFQNSGNPPWNDMSVYEVIEDKLWVDGWCKTTLKITIPSGAENQNMRILIYKLLIGTDGNPINNASSSQLSDFKLFIDDIRIMPMDANMQSFVFDNVNFRLMAMLNENHYATFYEYDDEGKLIRTKQETERGIMTIQESRQNIKKRP